jgi:hypothetical protein
MPDSVGTRTQSSFKKEKVDQGSETVSHTRDKFMSKRVVTSATFTASDGKITGSASDFAAFAVGDQILIQATNLNNGFKTVTALDGGSQAFLVLDPPPKNEGPVANTVVRAA